MIKRRHFAKGVTSEALYSECGLYRYKLSRRWADGPVIAYILLLAAEGTEVVQDIADGRCCRRAQMLGFGGMVMLNLFAYRVDSRNELFGLTAPVGPDNDHVIMQSCLEAQLVVCAWGRWGRHLGRDRIVLAQLAKAGIETYSLGLNRSGAPRHVLNVKDTVSPKLWKAGSG